MPWLSSGQILTIGLQTAYHCWLHEVLHPSPLGKTQTLSSAWDLIILSHAKCAHCVLHLSCPYSFKANPLSVAFFNKTMQWCSSLAAKKAHILIKSSEHWKFAWSCEIWHMTFGTSCAFLSHHLSFILSSCFWVCPLRCLYLFAFKFKFKV